MQGTPWQAALISQEQAGGCAQNLTIHCDSTTTAHGKVAERSKAPGSGPPEFNLNIVQFPGLRNGARVRISPLSSSSFVFELFCPPCWEPLLLWRRTGQLCSFTRDETKRADPNQPQNENPKHDRICSRSSEPRSYGARTEIGVWHAVPLMTLPALSGSCRNLATTRS